MSDKTTQERFREIVVEQLGVDAEQVTDSAELADDLGADSLDAIELVMAADEEFDITIADEDAEKVKTFGDAVALIDRLLDAKNQQPGEGR
ncbi:MAG TPA: acyl carrier protein [Chthoniobacteraceae bacterium]|jgi:acyl carrier protein